MTKKHFFFFLCLFFILYGVLLILKASFVVEGVRYFVLFDDEMVSMRYAKNLAHGLGLVWNVGGERVEGFTNPLWTLYMSLLHLLPIPLQKMGLLIQLSGLFLSLLTLILVKKLCSVLLVNRFGTVTALLLTAFYFPLVNWNVILGTEVSLLTLLLTSQAYLTVKILQTKRFSLLLFALLGIATLTRLDALVPSLIITLFLYVSVKQLRRKIISRGVPVLLSFLLLQEGIRIWYYHELLPNTYYLKTTGFPTILRMTRGFFVALQMINPVLVLQTAVYVLLKKRAPLTFISLLILSQVAYSITVGGDAWEFFGGTNRYVTVVMPLFFVLLSLSFSEIFVFLQKKYGIRGRNLSLSQIGTMFLLLIIMNTNTADEFVQWTTLKESYTMGQNRYQVDIANSINALSTPDAKVAITLAGVTPYFSKGRYFVDLLGKNDKHIARMSVAMAGVPQNKLKRFLLYNPGHMKSDISYSLHTYNPDIVVQPLLEEESPLLSKNYHKVRLHNQYDFFLRKGSKRVLWDTIAKENSGYQL
ncbi:MAG: hypothetical protein Q8Q49_06285 [bacterium]|nr:hypothetical protein [bacterium]